MEEKIPVVAVVGPTAAGKTSLGIALAKRFSGEIISCDSMQIYRGLPIGTAQPSSEELAEIPHHLISFLDVWEPFSVSDYVNLASKVILELRGRGKLPILVGGTGLYARSLLRGFVFEEHARDNSLRRELFQRKEREGPESLYEELKVLDPRAAEEIHPHNVKRVIRALEYCKLTGEQFSSQAERARQIESPYRSLMLCLSFQDREKLYARIDSRVDHMLEEGLLEEAEAFYQRCAEAGAPPTAVQAIGYKELFPYFRGECPLQDAVEDLKRESRRYAKRQITWFGKEPGAHFLYVDQWETPEALRRESFRLCEAFLTGKEGSPFEQ